MSAQSPLPRWISRWQPDKRRLFAWTALFGTMLTVLPGAIAILFVFLQADDCTQSIGGRVPFTCTPAGVGVIKFAMAVIIFPPALVWLRFIQRILKYEGESGEKEEGANSHKIGEASFQSGCKNIGMGQVMLSGKIEEVTHNSHAAKVNGECVGFLSVYPFRKSQLKRGGFVRLVYQNVPLLRNTKAVLAYSDQTAHTAFGASAWIYSLWVPLLIVCIIIFANLSPLYGGVMAGLCGALLALDLVYLSLMVRARSRLQSYLDNDSARLDSSSHL